MSREIIAIGDIHGFKTVLIGLLAKLNARHDLQEIPVVFLGDYVDRGDDEFGTLDYLIELEAKFQNFIFLLGNHEQDWIDNGHPSGHEIKPHHLAFIKRCRLYHTAKKFAFAHGGIPHCYKQIENVPTHELLLARNTWSGYNQYKLVVGHTIVPKVEDFGNYICTDTGVYMNGKANLSAVVLNDDNGKIVDTITEYNPKANWC